MRVRTALPVRTKGKHGVAHFIDAPSSTCWTDYTPVATTYKRDVLVQHSVEPLSGAGPARCSLRRQSDLSGSSTKPTTCSQKGALVRLYRRAGQGEGSRDVSRLQAGLAARQIRWVLHDLAGLKPSQRTTSLYANDVLGRQEP